MQSTRFAGEIADDAVQILGGRGLTQTGMGRFVEMFNRSYKFDSILGGAEEVLGDLGVRQVSSWIVGWLGWLMVWWQPGWFLVPTLTFPGHEGYAQGPAPLKLRSEGIMRRSECILCSQTIASCHVNSRKFRVGLGGGVVQVQKHTRLDSGIRHHPTSTWCLNPDLGHRKFPRSLIALLYNNNNNPRFRRPACPRERETQSQRGDRR